jgi:hypothetical protein
MVPVREVWYQGCPGTAHNVEAPPETRGDNEADRLQTHVAAAVLKRDGEC